ncbi:MAG: HDIG domain-containing protein [Candidatus Parcubacteria bacterium]|nr:MAG: HDIG domain-containing protein [Candidatus Parcubacteria bacterium]
MNKINISSLPTEVLIIWEKLSQSGFKAYLVGGCVRDLLLKRKPNDWDITTNATPEQILKIFKEIAFYENRFGTVGIKTNSNDESLKVIEVTTFRLEEKYSDFRRPDKVIFTDQLEKDLERRDFTINALALNDQGEIVDIFTGLKDLKQKIIRAVGDPTTRFHEDALRMLRAIRFACQLNFTIEEKTFNAIRQLADLIQYISSERIRDELIKILMSSKAVEGIELLRKTNLLKEILPELERSFQVTQNKHHKYDVYTHSLKSLAYAVSKNFPLYLRLAVLFHDIGKPLTKQGEGPDSTFYMHEIVGTKITKKILERLRFPKEIIKKVTHLVRHHMFYLEIDKVTMSAIRRFVRRVGEENLDDLFRLREADRIGSGVPKAVPYRLRYLKFLIEKVKQQPIKPTMLKINGYDILNLGVPQGPKVGLILKILLEEIIDNPHKNNREYLLKRIEELKNLSKEDLETLALTSEEKIEQVEKEIEEKLKKKYYL